MKEKIIIGIVQPTYLPWIPFFQRMIESDVFICLDDVKFSKNSNFNRNQIKGHLATHYLTIPIQYKNHSTSLIHEIKIDNTSGWQEKHCKTIKQYYSKTPFYEKYYSEIEAKINNNYSRLIEINYDLILLFKDFLKLNTPIYLSSELNLPGKGNEKLINICKHFGGTHFLVKENTSHYHPKEVFYSNGIELKIIDYKFFNYTQQFGAFIPGLSIIDFLFNCGSELFPRLFVINN